MIVEYSLQPDFRSYKSGDLTSELLDNFINKGDFVVSLVFVGDVIFTFVSANGDSVVVVGGRLEIDFPSLVLSSFGSLESDVHFIDVNFRSGFFGLEVFEFSLSVLEPDSEIPTSLNFGSFELSDSRVEMFFEGGEEIVNIFFNGSSSLNFGFGDFFFIISKLVEGGEGLFVEKVLVGSEFGERVFFNFNKFFWGGFSIDGSEKVASEEFDGFKGVIVFLEGSNEDLGGVASLVLEFNFSSWDISSSGVDPVDVGVGVSNFGFDVFSVGGGLVSRGFVELGNVEEISNFSITSVLVGNIFSVLLGLGVIVGLLKVKENIEGSIGGVSGLRGGLNQGLDLSGSSESGGNQHDSDSNGKGLHI
jgi:hypothetical protein